jgi:hypothetical protein
MTATLLAKVLKPLINTGDDVCGGNNVLHEHGLPVMVVIFPVVVFIVVVLEVVVVGLVVVGLEDVGLTVELITGESIGKVTGVTFVTGELNTIRAMSLS